MKYIKLNIMIIMFIFILAIGLRSADQSRFMVYIILDKSSYFLDESIDLKICVRNISDRNNEFTVNDFRDSDKSSYTTFQPQVYDMQGRLAELIVPYRLINKKLTTFLKELSQRKVELAPHEEITHTVNLKDVYNLMQGRTYRVKSYFFPDFNNNIMIVSSNKLVFTIRKDNTNSIISGVVEKNKRRVPARVLSPKEVILLALHAEKSNSTFEKYLNVGRLIYSFPKFYNLYQNSDDQEKISVEKDFIAYLHRDRHDYVLDFRITKEDFISATKASVEVVVDRFGIRRTNRYKYIYTLERSNANDAFWLITYLEAYVMKGIKR